MTERFDVSGPSLSLYPTPDLTTVGRQPPPTLVSDTLQAFPESYYKSPGSLARGETAIIRRNPRQKHIFFGGGRPRAGSSLVMSEIIKSLTWEGSDLAQFAREERLRISIAGLEWAQACLPFDLNPEVFQTTEHSQATAPPNNIGETYFGSIREWIKDEQEDTIGILGTTFTFNTGVTIDDTTLGQPRAEELFRDFVRKKGMFEGLDYEAVYISTDATPEVIEFTTEERLAMLQRPPGIERENFLESRGKIIKRKPGVKMLTLTGAASEENLLAIEEDVDQTLYGLLDSGLLELPADLSGWIVSKEDLKDLWLRSLAITRGLNPFIFKNLGIPRYRTSHFLNRQIHRQNVVVYRDIEEINPLIAYYPDLYEPYAMIA